jgi:hypothetical protein
VPWRCVPLGMRRRRLFRLLREKRPCGPRRQVLKHVGKTVEANTMADLPPRGLLGALPADDLLTPGTHNPEIPLAGEGLPRAVDHLLGRGDERAGVLDQLATTLGRDAADWGYMWAVHVVRPSEEGFLSQQQRHTFYFTACAGPPLLYPLPTRYVSPCTPSTSDNPCYVTLSTTPGRQEGHAPLAVPLGLPHEVLDSR